MSHAQLTLQVNLTWLIALMLTDARLIPLIQNQTKRFYAKKIQVLICHTTCVDIIHVHVQEQL